MAGVVLDLGDLAGLAQVLNEIAVGVLALDEIAVAVERQHSLIGLNQREGLGGLVLGDGLVGAGPIHRAEDAGGVGRKREAAGVGVDQGDHIARDLGEIERNGVDRPALADVLIPAAAAVIGAKEGEILALRRQEGVEMADDQIAVTDVDVQLFLVPLDARARAVVAI